MSAPNELNDSSVDEFRSVAVVIARAVIPDTISGEEAETDARKKWARMISAKIGAHVVVAKRSASESAKRVLKFAVWALVTCNIIPLFVLAVKGKIVDAVHWWEMIALLSTGLICAIIYFYDYYELREIEKENKKKKKKMDPNRDGSVMIEIFAYTGVLVLVALGGFVLLRLSHTENMLMTNMSYVLREGSPQSLVDKFLWIWKLEESDWMYVGYLGCVIFVGWLFTRIDERIGMQSYSFEESEEAAISQTFASFPALVSFGALALYGVIFVLVEHGATPIVRLFFGGAAAFQMLISNATFLAIKQRSLFLCLERYSRNVHLADD